MGKRMAAVVVVVGFLVVAGCGDDDDDAATPTTAAAGSDEGATPAGADFDVLFDGEECTVTGPDSVPSGSVTVVLTDTTEEGVDVDVSAYDDGYTYADLEDFVEEEVGGFGERVQFVIPDWAPLALRDFEAPGLGLAENQTQDDYSLEAGSHGIVVWRNGSWGCGGFEVT